MIDWPLYTFENFFIFTYENNKINSLSIFRFFSSSAFFKWALIGSYWSGSSSRHFLRFLSNIFKKQSRNLCFTPLLFCMYHNDLPTKWIFIKESARWSGIHYYDVAIFNRKWPQQKQFSPTFRNIVFCEAKASKGKKNDILEN